MLVRSMSGIDRAASANYVMLGPGVPVIATTPAVGHDDFTGLNRSSETTYVTAGIVSSLLVFLMWVGAWGCVDTIVELITDNVLYQLGLYISVAVIATLGMWLQLADWRKTAEEDAMAV